MKDMDKLVLFAQSQGWHVQDTSKHLRFVGPDGQFVIVPSTPSDWRSFQNSLSDLRKAGLNPPRKRIKKKVHEGTDGRAIAVAEAAGVDLTCPHFPHINEIMGQWRHTSWFDDQGQPLDEDEWGRYPDKELVAAVILGPATGFTQPTVDGAVVGLNSKALAARPGDRTLFIYAMAIKYWNDPDHPEHAPSRCWCGFNSDLNKLALHIVKHWERDERDHCPVASHIVPWTDPNDLRLLMGADEFEAAEELRRQLLEERDRRRAVEEELQALKAKVKALVG